MSFRKIGIVTVVAMCLIAIATYLSSAARKPSLQARLFIAGATNFAHRPCPNLAVFSSNASDENLADYELVTDWDGKNWDTNILFRQDGVTIREFPPSSDSAQIFREVCQATATDFPIWLATQRERTINGNSGQSSRRVDGGSAGSDPPRRYEMTEYKHGTIIGLAMLDTELGRAWVLTDLVNPGGKKERTQFSEVSVEDLWESSDEAEDKVAAASTDSSRKDYADEIFDLYNLKMLTRPTAVQNAEDKVAAHRRNSK